MRGGILCDAVYVATTTGSTILSIHRKTTYQMTSCSKHLINSWTFSTMKEPIFERLSRKTVGISLVRLQLLRRLICWPLQSIFGKSCIQVILANEDIWLSCYSKLRKRSIRWRSWEFSLKNYHLFTIYHWNEIQTTIYLLHDTAQKRSKFVLNVTHLFLCQKDLFIHFISLIQF